MTWQECIGGKPVGALTTLACVPRLYCQTAGNPAHMTTRARDGSRLNCLAGGIAHCRRSRRSRFVYCATAAGSVPIAVGALPPTSSARNCS